MKLFRVIYKLPLDKVEGSILIYSKNKETAIQHMKSIYSDVKIIKIKQEK